MGTLSKRRIDEFGIDLERQFAEFRRSMGHQIEALGGALPFENERAALERERRRMRLIAVALAAASAGIAVAVALRLLRR